MHGGASVRHLFDLPARRAFGGVRSLQLAQQLLLKLGCVVVPGQCVLAQAHEAFDEQGRLKSPRAQKAVDRLAANLVRLCGRLAG